MASDPSSQLSTKSICVGELLKSAYFEIPPNQREYRWRKGHIEKFWNDLKLTIEEDRHPLHGRLMGHFLGAVVIVGDDKSHPAKRWQVIDGQQRLTTITILADCLRPYIEQVIEKKPRDRWGHVLMDCVCSPNTDYEPRVRLNREHEFYKTTIIDCESLETKRAFWSDSLNEDSEVQINLKFAFEYFSQKIDEYVNHPGADKDDRTAELAETLTNNFYVLLVRTEALWMAYRLFETLNERGLALTQADLIRNTLLEHAEESGKKVFTSVSERWSLLIDSYESQAISKLELPQIIQFSYSYRHTQVKKEQIFDYIAEDLRKNRQEPQDFAVEFLVDAQNWSAFLLGDLASWEQDLAESQYAIVDILWKSHCTPYIFAIMERYRSEPNAIENHLRLCEHYLFRQGTIGHDTVSSLQDFFTTAAKQVRLGTSHKEIAAFFVENSSTETFLLNFENAALKNMKQAFYTIWKIEKHLSSKMGFTPKKQSAAQHVEHILPKKPDETWGDISKDDRFTDYLNRIGNIMVLPSEINQAIKNHSFEFKSSNEKEVDYGNCDMHLAKELLDNLDAWTFDNQWTFESIALRQKHLAEKYAADVWELE